MVATCGGTYTDNGGTGSNYSNNINEIYRTFCPNTAGNCMRATFWSFDVEPASIFIWDYLTIRNGPTQGSPEFGGVGISTWYGTATSYAACMGAGLGPYVSTDQSGCLTFFSLPTRRIRARLGRNPRLCSLRERTERHRQQ